MEGDKAGENIFISLCIPIIDVKNVHQTIHKQYEKFCRGNFCKGNNIV
jgi:hypothetical protein